MPPKKLKIWNSRSAFPPQPPDYLNSLPLLLSSSPSIVLNPFPFSCLQIVPDVRRLTADLKALHEAEQQQKLTVKQLEAKRAEHSKQLEEARAGSQAAVKELEQVQ